MNEISLKIFLFFVSLEILKILSKNHHAVGEVKRSLGVNAPGRIASKDVISY